MMAMMVIIIILPFMDHFTHIGSALPDKHPEKCYFLILQFGSGGTKKLQDLPKVHQEDDFGVWVVLVQNPVFKNYLLLPAKALPDTEHSVLAARHVQALAVQTSSVCDMFTL